MSRTLFRIIKMGLVSAAVFLFLALPAGSYVLSGPHLLYRMMEKLGNFDTLMVTGILRLYNDEEDTGAYVDLSETVRFSAPEYFRSDVFSDISHHIYIATLDNQISILNDKIVPSEGIKFNSYKDILVLKSIELLKHQLRRQGIDPEVSSVGRYGEKLVYVVGAMYPDETTPQLVIDKSSFLPVRFILQYGPENGPQKIMDIRFPVWSKIDKIYYPGKIEFYTNGRLAQEFLSEEKIVNPSFAENTFDISYFMSLYSSGFSAPADDDTADKIDEVQKTIDDFNKIYE